MPTEREKMLAGELYDPLDPELVAVRERARNLCQDLNATREARRIRAAADSATSCSAPAATMCRSSRPSFATTARTSISAASATSTSTASCSTCAPSALATTRYSARTCKSTRPRTRLMPSSAATQEFGKPVTIGSDVWVGGGAIICPGVTIGSRSIIGAGSVVTRDIPDAVFAAGNPCRVVRELNE